MQTNISIYQVKLKKIGEFEVPYEAVSISHPNKVSEVLRHYLEEYCHTDRENFIALYLNTKLKIVAITTVHVGSLDASVVHPREVFKEAILHNAASIIVCHQHPSGDPTPSREDIQVTKSLAEAGGILGIELIDHIILGSEGKYTSLKQEGHF